MDRDEYNNIAKVGEKMWWFRALHRNILNALQINLPDLNGNLLDDGCGAGGFLRQFKEAFDLMSIYGIDMDYHSAKIAHQRSDAEVVIGSANLLPYRDQAFSACISTDVLCHKLAIPEDIASEAFRCLKTSGVLVLNVPAYKWLFSVHDRRVHSVRRFTRASLIKILEKAGFQIEYSTYWNTFLFGLMMARRKVFTLNEGESELKLMPPVIEATFNAVMICESAVLSLGMRTGIVLLPFGGSVLAVAKRPVDEAVTRESG